MCLLGEVIIFCASISIAFTHLIVCLDESDGFCKSTSNEVTCLQDTVANCIQRVENGSANITIAPGNTAAIASQITTNISIIGELISPENREKVVVVISTSHLDVFKNQGLKYCHPGEPSSGIAPWLLNEYSRSILKENSFTKCQNRSVTIIENDLAAWNSIFGPSCIPGQWAADDKLDNDLKSRYPKLRELCVHYQQGKDGLRQSLDCLVSNKGDIAVTSLAVAKSYVEKNPNVTLYFVCKDGKVIDGNEPCVWSSQSGPLLLTNKYMINDILPTMRQEFPDNFSSASQNVQNQSRSINLSLNAKAFLGSVVINDKMIYETTKTGLKEYMEDIDGIPSSGMACKRRSSNWCTISKNEYNKCLWMKETAASYGLNPIACKLLISDTSDRFECIKDIEQQGSDVTFIDNKHAYTAMKTGLKMILISKDRIGHMTRSLLVVNPAKITKLSELKGKNACFAEAFDAGFLSFVDVMKEDILTSGSCLYDEGISKYVERACIPGIRDPMLKASRNIDENRMCKQCEATAQSPTAVNCNADATENLYAGNKGALMCLDLNKGDYAVITMNSTLTENIQLVNGVKVMCRNGTMTDTLDDVDDHCYLSVLPAGGIVVDKKSNRDVQLTFMGLAQVTKSISSPFDIFGDFQGEENLLFPKSVYGFVLPDNSNSTHQDALSKHAQRFTSMLNSADKCNVKTDPIKKGSWSMTIALVVIAVIAAAGVIVVVFWYMRRYRRKRSTEATPPEEIPFQG